MKRLGHPLLSLAAPLLITLALLGLLQRQARDRLQVLPGVLVGAGLIISGAVGRSRRRSQLLMALRGTNLEES
ncbi:MAG: DUF3188 domain-containing protein [Prochlorococcaceae cyanobacterium ETNP14_MAG_4]|jgi:hypothetical protein|nr:DUF3188 domain-containing protein [Prochlorococcaceae cyanobacterium ETNP14_MAG_4]